MLFQREALLERPTLSATPRTAELGTSNPQWFGQGETNYLAMEVAGPKTSIFMGDLVVPCLIIGGYTRCRYLNVFEDMGIIIIIIS